MAIYETKGDDSGMEVFLRETNAQKPRPPRGDVPPPPPPRKNRGSGGLMNAVILGAVVIAAAAGAWVSFRPGGPRMSPPIEDSAPFRQSAAYLMEYDELVQSLGPGIQVYNAGDSELQWSLDGQGAAYIHLLLHGPTARTEAWVEWNRDRDTWFVQKANYLAGDQRIPVPLGDGAFLSPHELAGWRGAAPRTPVGRGKRELIQGRPFQAIQLFNEALETNTNEQEAILWRGRAFESVGNHPKALADYQRLLTFDPQHAAALARLDAMRASPPPGQPLAQPPQAPKPTSSPAEPRNLIPE